MAFETFPIPEDSPKLDVLNQRIAAQHEMLMPIITKLYGAMNGAIQQQGTALSRVGGKLTRAINGRIKNQAAALQPVVDALYGAINDGIAQNGRALDVQSAILSRLAPAAGDSSASLSGQNANPFSFVPSVGGAGAAPNVRASIPSPPGAQPPPFSLSPQEVIPPSAISLTRPPPPPGSGAAMILVNCDTRSPMLYLQNDPYTIGAVQAGHFVPIRYDVPNTITQAFFWVQTYAPNAVERACHAYLNKGEGWPAGGDFQELGGLEAIIGNPVGPWPFDENGNYTGS